MSCEEEEESSMDEDDDMPGLESVSSSEYVSDEDSVVFSSEGEQYPSPAPPVDHKSNNYITAQKWLNQSRGDVINQIQVITVHLLSPFLYGCSRQSDKWLGWCFKVGLLQSDVNYNTGTLKDIELCAVYVLEKAMEWCKESATKEGMSPTNLAELLQLATDVKRSNKLHRAIHLARKRKVFITMVESVKATPMTTCESDQDPQFIETACLYVISQTAEHVDNVINESINIVKEHEEYCQTENMKYDNMISKGDELKEQGRMKDTIAQYTTTVNLCSYNYKLYTSRAHCSIATKEYRAAMADGLRAVYLKPGWSKGHLRYIQGLDGCGMIGQASLAKKRYAQLFPGRLDDVSKILETTEKTEPTAGDHALFNDIMQLCKRASVSYQEGNLTNTTYWYEEVWQKIKKNNGWKRCMDVGECDKFMVSMHYVYGSALLGRLETVSVETSIPHFETIMTDYTSIKFPGAYFAAGRAYCFLRQHSDAVAMAKLGLEMVAMTSSCARLVYPGTDTVMEDSTPDVIEARLKRLLQQCKISAIPDAVCRYTNCLSYNSSSRIWSSHLDYRGHISLECNDDCCIAYHPSCWRKYKTETEQKTDKEFLLSPCATPDCFGFVSVVIVYDNKGAIKAKFEAPAESIAALTKKSSAKSSSPLPPSSSSSSSSAVTGKKAKRRKNTEKDNDKPSPVTDDSKSLVKEEKKKPDSDKSESVKGKGEVAKGKNENGKIDNGKVESGKELKGEGGKNEKVNGVKGLVDEEKMEDMRRAEDSLVVIDRQREAEAAEAGKGKVKKKKVKKMPVVGGVVVTGGDKHWNDFFTLPEREGMMGENAVTDERWRPDPKAPFQTPSHLREAVEEFERSQVPAIGLGPNSIPPLHDSVTNHQQGDEDLEFIYSFFSEIFKTHGPLKPTDLTLIESLSLLPEEKKILIASAGGIETFLLRSSTFCSHEGLICLTEDSPIIVDSINNQHSSASSTASTEPPVLTPEETLTTTTTAVGNQEKTVSSSSSLTSGSSPRDSPHYSPQPQKKTTTTTTTAAADKPEKIGKKTKSSKTSKNEKTNGNNGTATTVAVAGTSSRVDKIESNGISIKPVTESLDVPPKPGMIHHAVQTARLMMTEHWVMTDPIPTPENFKERYEMVMREKIDLRAKLEESEDRRFKLQRDHKREQEKMSKTIRQEAKEEAQTKIRELDSHAREEKEKLLQEKRDQGEQIKAHKAEIKSLSDKVDRMKKEITRRDQKLENVHLKHQTDIERMSSEQRKAEERLRMAQDHTRIAMQRAISAEVDLLQLRVENVRRPGEARLMEIDRICSHIPPNSDLHREWLAYQEKLRTAIECFQMATEEQVQAARSGRELSSMEKIPNPSVPLPAHLAFRGLPMMRPPFPGPMRMPMRGPPPPVPMGVRPVLEGQSPPVPFPTPGGHPGVMPPHPMQHPPQPHVEVPGAVAAALPQTHTEPSTTTITSSQSQPNLLQHPSLHATPSHPPPPPTTGVATSEGTAEHRPSKSSFDRIVEKLVPHYPSYSRDDFKLILREVRRNNNNTLSGLSLDSIAEQVRIIIETRERAKGGSVDSASGKNKSRNPLPPVALAPPPINTTVEYTDEWSCVICYEDMDASDSRRLMCGHRFHTECIKSWFKEQNTCPTCRNYALLPDEYPFLS